MKQLKDILLEAFLLCCLITIIQGECENGTMTFILSNNIIANATYYSKSSEPSLEQCVQKCERHNYCKSLIFQRNESTSVCYLYDSATNVEDLQQMPQSSHVGSYHMEKICLKGMCEQRLFSLELAIGGQLDTTPNDHITLQNMTRNQCLDQCLLETKFPCRSITYDIHNELCRLHRYDRYSRSTRFKMTTNKHWLYFDNNCALRPAFEGTTAEVILLGNAQHPYILSEYEGKSVGECGQLCLKSVQFPCRSFLYGKKNGATYCALSHQNRIGLLNNKDSFSLTESLNYYEIAQKLEVCDTTDIHFELTSGVYLEDEPYKVTNDLPQEKCLTVCRHDSNCHALSISHWTSTCIYHQLRIRTMTAERLRSNGTYNYFEKICLQSSQSCSQLWAFERIRSRKFAYPSARQLTTAFTKEQCLASCLEQQDFQCHSAEYDQRLSVCHLSTVNRFSSNDKMFKMQPSANSGNYYYENNCVKEPRGFCNTKTNKKLRFANPDQIKHVSTLHECKVQCLEASAFNCHSYSYNAESKECYLSHHTMTTIPHNLIQSEANVETYEITTCYDVSVTCEPHMMKVNVKTNTPFNGKMYVRSKPDTCYVDVSKSTNFSFPILLTGPECDTENEGEGRFSNVIVIQNNDLVLTSMDKAIGVHCTYELGNKTEYAILTIKNISNIESTRGRASPPQLKMRILDTDGNDKTTVKLGEPLRVQVSVPDESAYGIFVRNMIATDATGTSNLTLIDSKGCPAEAKMIREMRRIDGQSRALESVMEAFTFTGSNILRIETDVETCLDACNPVVCHVPSGRSDDQYFSVESLGRKKREVSKDVQVFKLTKTVAIHSDKFGVGYVQKEILDKNNLMSTAAPFSNDKDDYEYVEEMVSSTASTNMEVCMNSYFLTIGGCLFVFLQVMLVTICCGAKYYQITQQRQKNRHSLQQISQFNRVHRKSIDDIQYQCTGSTTEIIVP